MLQTLSYFTQLLNNDSLICIVINLCNCISINNTFYLQSTLTLLIMKKPKSVIESIKKDIAYCIDELNLDNEMIGELLRICEEVGVSCEYFMNEFVCNDDNSDPIHDPEYLSIREVNRLYYTD